jgi:hypothetical protein
MILWLGAKSEGSLKLDLAVGGMYSYFKRQAYQLIIDTDPLSRKASRPLSQSP